MVTLFIHIPWSPIEYSFYSIDYFPFFSYPSDSAMPWDIIGYSISIYRERKSRLFMFFCYRSNHHLSNYHSYILHKSYYIFPYLQLHTINSNLIERFFEHVQQSLCLPLCFSVYAPSSLFPHSAKHFVIQQDFQQSQQCDILYTHTSYRFCDKFTIEIFEDV